MTGHEQLAYDSDGRYEDAVDVLGEVRAVDLDGCSFYLRLKDGSRIPGEFLPQEQKARLLDALHGHPRPLAVLNGDLIGLQYRRVSFRQSLHPPTDPLWI